MPRHMRLSAHFWLPLPVTWHGTCLLTTWSPHRQGVPTEINSRNKCVPKCAAKQVSCRKSSGSFPSHLPCAQLLAWLTLCYHSVQPVHALASPQPAGQPMPPTCAAFVQRCCWLPPDWRSGLPLQSSLSSRPFHLQMNTEQGGPAGTRSRSVQRRQATAGECSSGRRQKGSAAAAGSANTGWPCAWRKRWGSAALRGLLWRVGMRHASQPHTYCLERNPSSLPRCTPVSRDSQAQAPRGLAGAKLLN